MPDPDPVKLTFKGDSVILCAKRVSDGEFIPLVVNDDGTLAVGSVQPTVASTAGVPKAPKTVPTAGAEPIIGTATPANLVRVQADFANAADSYICIGDSTVTLANGEQLGPGDTYSEAVDDAAKLYCIGSASGLKLRIKVL